MKQQFTKHVCSIGSFADKYVHDSQYLSKKIGTIISLWSKRLAPGLPCEGFEFLDALANSQEVTRFVDWLCELSFIDGAYWLSSAYSIWVGNDYRKHLAMYFTPPSLTKRLLDDLEGAGASFTEHSFFDPACGGAAFLAPIAERMKAALKNQGKTSAQIVRHVEQKLFGVDIDSTLCRMANHFLRIALADEIVSSGISPSFHVAAANSLTDIRQLYGAFDIIVCNPPYRKMPKVEVEKYRNEYGHIIDSQPNLYGLFLALGLKLLKPNGIAGFVTPTSYMSGRYFCKLRTHLMEQSDIASIGLIRDRSGVFIDVEQETVLTLLRRRNQKQSMQLAARVSVVSKQGKLTSVGNCALPQDGATWPIPRAQGDAQLIRAIRASKFRLVDYGVVPRTGLFVWNRDSRRTYYQLSDALRDRAKVVMPLIWSSDITTDGSVKFGENKKFVGEPSYVDIQNSNAKGIIRNPAVLLQRVTSNDQPLRLVTAVLPNKLRRTYGGFVGENHLIALESIEAVPKFPLTLLAKLLGAQPVDRYFRCISGSTNVSIFELQQLPLPDPRRLLQLLQAGKALDEAVLHAYQ